MYVVRLAGWLNIHVVEQCWEPEEEEEDIFITFVSFEEVFLLAV